VLGITAELEDFHAVAQGFRDDVQLVSSGNELP
jgi:hypothetical protein